MRLDIYLVIDNVVASRAKHIIIDCLDDRPASGTSRTFGESDINRHVVGLE